MRAIFTLLLVTAVATALDTPESYVDRNLRGANTEDRDLITGSSSAKSISFSLSAALGAKDFCFDYAKRCLEVGYTLAAADTGTLAVGNAYAEADTEEHLWMVASCFAWADAYAYSCAHAKADGKIDVTTRVIDSNKHVSLNVRLNTCSWTLSVAESTAVAGAYAAVGARSYTSVTAFCQQVNNMSPLCAGGTAGTDLKQIAKANALSFGDAFAISSSSAFAGSTSMVQASGQKLWYVNGMVSAYATSFSFSAAEADATAIASAFTAIANKSWALVCAAKHGEICGSSGVTTGICGMTADVACAAALTAGAGFATALSVAVARAYINAVAHAATYAFVSANVDCTNTPILTWNCTSAGVENYCGSY